MKKPEYLPVQRLKNSTNKEIAKLFGEVLSVSYQGNSLLRSNILTAFYFCTYLTVADISYYLGLPENGFSSLRRQLEVLINSGLLEKQSLKTKDCFSTVMYHLTELGYAAAASYVKEADVFLYKKRRKTLTIMHDYSVGQNALQLILYKKPFSWANEVVFKGNSTGRKNGGKVENSVCVDAVCNFQKENYKFFIEEDLGYENINVLISKLKSYSCLNLFDNPARSCLVFSFRKPFVTCDTSAESAYSAKNVEAVKNVLTKSGVGLREALLLAEKDVPSLLSNVGDISESLLLDTMQSLSSVLKLSYSPRDICASDLDLFIKEFKEYKLDCRVESYNYYQEEFTRSRFRSLATSVALMYHRDSDITSSFLSDFMRGYSAYCTSTTLLANEVPYYLYKSIGMDQTFAYCLSSVYDGVSPQSYSFIMDSPLEYSVGPPRTLRMRNIFKFSHGIICVEYLGRDLGAVARVLRFFDSYMNPGGSIYLLCILEQMADFYFFENKVFCQDIRIPLSKDGIPLIIFLDKSSLQGKPYFFTLNSNHELREV